MATFEVYEDKKGAWRWRLKAKNGEIMAQGEGHPDERRAREAVARVVVACKRPFTIAKVEAPAPARKSARKPAAKKPRKRRKKAAKKKGA